MAFIAFNAQGGLSVGDTTTIDVIDSTGNLVAPVIESPGNVTANNVTANYNFRIGVVNNSNLSLTSDPVSGNLAIVALAPDLGNKANPDAGPGLPTSSAFQITAFEQDSTNITCRWEAIGTDVNTGYARIGTVGQQAFQIMANNSGALSIGYNRDIYPSTTASNSATYGWIFMQASNGPPTGVIDTDRSKLLAMYFDTSSNILWGGQKKIVHLQPGYH